MNALTLASFVFFTALVAFITWRMTRHDDYRQSGSYFLAGRSLTFPIIAGSLLMTNLSTEQMVGLNGAAFTDGLSVMAWEVIAVVTLVTMAMFFLPRFLKSGVTTVPELLALRFDRTTQLLANIIFVVAYAAILLPSILYSGALGLMGLLDLQTLTGIESNAVLLVLTIVAVGVGGAIYALFGGLRSIAISDTINGVGLLIGGLMIVYFGLNAISDGQGILAGWDTLKTSHPEKLRSWGTENQSVPFSTIFTGVLLLNMFYWCTNQQIIQRTFAAKTLAEGQKGVLLTGLLKLLGPLYLVLPGIIAFHMYVGEGVKADAAYGQLVHDVLPAPLTGFFAAAMVGAILSSFNSALNSTATLFSLDVYKARLKPNATDAQVVRASKWSGWLMAIAAMSIAPLMASQESLFVYVQKVNSLYYVPLLSVILVGFLTRRVPAIAANLALVLGCVIIAAFYFVPPLASVVDIVSNFHFIAIVMVLLVLMMLVIGKVTPRAEPWVQQDAGAIDMTPWSKAWPASIALLVLVVAIYLAFI
ncbi:solute:sodium symporter family transporter [Kushneria pakistanensis]|uniref:Solute:sodium symporter family transporter n=1 Tax=Kushneria pakistanensis TaxID=1508770 RepID=A0ABQ3FLZ4_9GAMM|nr:solute:sodium symporter family transporter [Kushneria pakistanensis]GHC29620.1 solute:sodium symporter family transporter [Kushneria pakistanensis]